MTEEDELAGVRLDTNYICKRTKTLVRTQFWVGELSVAVRYLSQNRAHLNMGKVIPLSTFSRCYEEFKYDYK